MGNPPTTTPVSAIANCFPGLEFDFRNIWRRIFIGAVLHEADNLVVDVEPTASAALEALKGKRLVTVNGTPVMAPITGPTTVGGVPETLVSAHFPRVDELTLADIVTRWIDRPVHVSG